jgi:hypothetical protein
MQRLLTAYSIYFNRVHGRSGHLFEDRYKAIECRNDAYLIQLASYIHMNPVRAGMVKTPAEWPWSSHQEFVGGERKMLDLGRLQEVVGMTVEHLREAYLERIAPRPSEGPQTLTMLLQTAANSCGVDPRDLASGAKGHGYTKARRILAQLGIANGYTLREVAQTLHCSRASLAELLCRIGV